MTKVRFYCSVPEYKGSNTALFASTNQIQIGGIPNQKVIAFDVDLPPDLYKECDIVTPAKFVGTIQIENK